ncbi:MAG: hypothetical protein WCP20_10615 [Desulfuromonadales bacterium]
MIKLLITYLTILLAIQLTMLPREGNASEEKTGTLRKIANSGTIALGFHETTVPFSYNAGEGKVMGYSYDIALKVADAIKRELKLPALQIKQVPVTTKTAFPWYRTVPLTFTAARRPILSNGRRHLPFPTPFSWPVHVS